jgi:hypothetical protein
LTGILNLEKTPFQILEYSTVSPIAEGLRLDYGGNVPEELSKHTPLSFIGSPFQLAQLQEPRFFKENPNAGAALWESAFLVGDKKLFDTFRLEMDRILGRKEFPQSRSLRQQRGVNMIRNDVQDFVPKLNRDINTEEYVFTGPSSYC